MHKLGNCYNNTSSTLLFTRSTFNEKSNTRYEQHPEVPLGIKAVVCAIYEPPQVMMMILMMMMMPMMVMMMIFLMMTMMIRMMMMMMMMMHLLMMMTINEPPQESSKDTLRILPDPNDEIVEEAASKMGLRKVGWIFTDLVPSATTANKVNM